MPHVFISHVSEEKKEAKQIKKGLNDRFIHTWIDEDNLRAGERLLDSILKAINEKKYFVALISKRYLESNYCELEYKYASERKVKNAIKIIPVSYGDRNELISIATKNGQLDIARDLESSSCVEFNEYDTEKSNQQISQGITGSDAVWFDPIRRELIGGIEFQVIPINQAPDVPYDLLSNWDYNLEEFIAIDEKDKRPIKPGLPVVLFGAQINWLVAHLSIPFKNKRSLFVYNHRDGGMYVCVYTTEAKYKGLVIRNK